MSKKTLIVLTTLLSVFALTIIFLNSCRSSFIEDGEETKKDEIKTIILIDDGARITHTGYKTVNIDGHDYIVFRGNNCISVIHSESCSCKKKK